MNKARRKDLRSVIKAIKDAKARLEEVKAEQLEVIKDGALNDLKEEEEEYRDNIPENLQGSERYVKAEEACDALEEAVSSFEEAIESLENAISSLEDVMSKIEEAIES